MSDAGGYGQRTVLVVEDDEDISRALRLRFEMAGLRVAQAFDAYTAFEIAKDAGPELVVMDISMPGGDGFDVASQLRDDDQLAQVPIIFLTASSRPDLKARAESAGAAAFLKKPFNAKDLVAVAQRLIGTA